MKRKMYTLSHNRELLKKIDNNGGLFTAEEHARCIEEELGDTVFKTKENLLRSYLPGNLSKLGSLGFLLDMIKEDRYHSILSLGAGQCVLEHLLKMSLPEETKISAVDFDPFFVKKAKQFFPDITVARFDFFKDEIPTLMRELDTKVDLAVFFGSTYVMDDPQFIRLFRGLKEIGVKRIIDFQGGYMDAKEAMMYLFQPLVGSAVMRKLLRRPSREEFKGKFHGYSRDRNELRRLYAESGWRVTREISAAGYRYVAILG
jgi:hypothetical protein